MTSGTHENTAIALEFLHDMENGGFGAAKRHLKPGFVWWTPRSGEIQAKMEAIDAALAKHFDSPMKIKVHGVTAQRDRVAVEAESYAVLTDGTIYNNRYHFLFEFDDGKIAVVKEYNDSQHAADVWGHRLG